MHTLGRLVRVAVVAALGVALSAVAMAPAATSLLRAGSSSRSGLDLDPLAQRSIVYAADGSVLSVLHAEENRAAVSLSEVPPEVIRVILAVEDEHFFEHHGINLRSTARALMSNVEAGGIVQGGSTITQQVIKNSLLTPERDLNRKVREAVLALRLEGELDKDAILERYLNTVYFGNGAYGLQAAAETYWGKSAHDLTVADAALLAAVIRNPVGYDPIRFPEVARTRRDLVADRLVAVGFIGVEEANEVRSAPLPDARLRVAPSPEDHFVETVKQSLLDDPRLGDTSQARFAAIFRGGLRIYTTLDPVDQRAAEAAVTSRLPDTNGRFTAALVSVEPATGAVRALVGGPGFEQSRYNLATQARRQPGSAFKPIVLATALAQGYSTRDTINGVGPCRLKLPGWSQDWTPKNYGNSRGSVTSLESQLQRSVNCAFARLGLIVGPDEVVKMARSLGIESPLDPVPAISLGTEEVTPLEMAGAYAAFANDGEFVQPYLIERVEDRTGKVLFAASPNRRRVLEVNQARMQVAAMERVVTAGTGTAARLRGRDVAGKTGTAQDYGNAWFVGFTPQRSTAVWMGAISANIPMTNVGGIRVAGGTYPARIWQAYMAAALAGKPSVPFAAPDWSKAPRRQYLRLPGERIVRSTPAPAPPSGGDDEGGGPTTTQPASSGGSTTTTPSGTTPTTSPTPTSSPPPTTSPGGAGGGGGGGSG